MKKELKQTTKQKLSAIKEMVKENASDMRITPQKLFKQIANEGQQRRGRVYPRS